MNLQNLVILTHYEHSRKVSQISGMLAKRAGFSSWEADIIEQAAAFHDVGKSYVPESILQKNGALTPEEYEIVKTHAVLGAQRISDALRILTAANTMAALHHERPDGKGYPYGLGANEIHPYARLVAVVDVFDALLSKRAYKNPWQLKDVCDYMQQNAGTQFDREYVQLLLSLVDTVAALYNRIEPSNNKKSQGSEVY